jgi:hypothetical protein
MEKLIKKLSLEYPRIYFKEAAVASWSPSLRQVSYTSTGEKTGAWSVLHELGHALLEHQSYESDISLLQKEAEAWEKASSIAERYKVTIDQEHIQNCLDTYRDWLHKRSTCPTCSSHGLQQNKTLYRCLNCQGAWNVSSARFCRPYRLKKALEAQKRPRLASGSLAKS